MHWVNVDWRRSNFSVLDLLKMEDINASHLLQTEDIDEPRRVFIFIFRSRCIFIFHQHQSSSSSSSAAASSLSLLEATVGDDPLLISFSPSLLAAVVGDDGEDRFGGGSPSISFSFSLLAAAGVGDDEEDRWWVGFGSIDVDGCGLKRSNF
ncbi:hypothetical protein Q3G72_017550 [Acer saccharum]|nr:hypothetical protein Q3G72_017550 [Acer saccharum]